MKPEFKTTFAENIFKHKYALSPSQTWHEKARSIVLDVCGKGYNKQYNHSLLSNSELEFLVNIIFEQKFIPGGRYIYYAGRLARFYNNCYLLKSEEDTREDWAETCRKAMSCLATGGGIGNDYSIYRPEGQLLRKTGGLSSGPIPLMEAINEIGRRVMQGGSRRSAIYASLNWKHRDIEKFLHIKDWEKLTVGTTGLTVWDLKQQDFNYKAPLDMTNVSVNYDNRFLQEIGTFARTRYESFRKIPKQLPQVFIENVRQALRSAEPGFSFNFYEKENETLRNACTEVTSEDDSDVCNLGSINMGNIDSLEEFTDIVRIASKFLVCGTIRGEVPYKKVYDVREKNRRLGLGLMGMHEWLLKRGQQYEVTEEMHKWLAVYEKESEKAANAHCDRLYLSTPKAYRAIAPTGTIGILAGTTTGIEPLFAVAYKRRYLVNSNEWKFEYVIDSTADHLIKTYGLNPEKIESASSMSKDFEKRIKFQADVQDYVDMAISSTINLPSWGSETNNEDTVEKFAHTLAKYSPRLRGFTCYPDGARGGQPITEVPYLEAINKKGVVFDENEERCKGGICGV